MSCAAKVHHFHDVTILLVLSRFCSLFDFRKNTDPLQLKCETRCSKNFCLQNYTWLPSIECSCFGNPSAARTVQYFGSLQCAQVLHCLSIWTLGS
mmetsp:Transcript_10679/g.18994  ORF Transcript_10679/g.18994 Transcript_10679/m.18994 type:complete len:95 (+) Transcript_10679:1246-1530(+)